jgi:hypothetical protein
VENSYLEIQLCYVCVLSSVAELAVWNCFSLGECRHVFHRCDWNPTLQKSGLRHSYTPQ